MTPSYKPSFRIQSNLTLAVLQNFNIYVSLVYAAVIGSLVTEKIFQMRFNDSLQRKILFPMYGTLFTLST